MAIWDVDGETLAGQTCASFERVLALTDGCAMVAIDIPIGLLETGSRICDLMARRLLGRGRSSSVFPAPLRPFLHARTRAEAAAVRSELEGKAVGYQAFAIVGKVRQVDELMTPALQDRVVEGHPELAFLSLTGGPVVTPKRTAEGFAIRQRALAGVLPPFDALLSGTPPRRAARDDILDALVLAWLARRIASGAGHHVPAGEPPRDAHGLRMEIWF